MQSENFLRSPNGIAWKCLENPCNSKITLINLEIPGSITFYCIKNAEDDQQVSYDPDYYKCHRTARVSRQLG